MIRGKITAIIKQILKKIRQVADISDVVGCGSIPIFTLQETRCVLVCLSHLKQLWPMHRFNFVSYVANLQRTCSMTLIIDDKNKVSSLFAYFSLSSAGL